MTATARALLFKLYRLAARRLWGRGLGTIRPLATLHKMIVVRLKPTFVEIEGHTLYLDDIDSLHLSILDTFEPLETDLVKREVKRGDHVLDVGAHIGYFTLLFAKLVGNEGTVFAFEPEPRNFALLRKNVGANGYGNVVLVNKAVSNRTGPARLYLSEDNRGDHRLFDSYDGRRSINVECIRLDDYFATHERVDFIKMDIQGAEAMALEGMTALWERNRAIKLLTEFWPDGIRRAGRDPRAYLRALQGEGFALSALEHADRLANVPETLTEFLESNPTKDYVNVFCVRSG